MVVILLGSCRNKELKLEVEGKHSGDAEWLPKKSVEWPEHFGYGRTATTKEVARWDDAIATDGRGLPKGSGNYSSGRAIYGEKCAACHGRTGVEGPFPHLVSSDTSKAKTIGNYWPYATTVFDYIRRAMPFNAPGSLTDHEVYSLIAYLLAANHITDSGMVMNAVTLPEVKMPAKSLFIADDRKGGNEVR